MLRMSKLADYAFIILTQMAQETGQTWPASVLAQETTLPLPTVAKLMKLLARSSIVTAQRGASGGYSLMRDPQTISIADIIEAVDGPISLTECAGKALGKPHCDCAVSKCPTKESWGRVNQAIRRSLEIVFLSDLIVTETAAG
ncbi:MAG: SUF system Fe-S cluster assembly regulator [Alphaproteobacteria bacterium]|nr:SUF system Fe-S cluster assembly regulator [Alphaproteobacteria bacterium]